MPPRPDPRQPQDVNSIHKSRDGRPQIRLVSDQESKSEADDMAPEPTNTIANGAEMGTGVLGFVALAFSSGLIMEAFGILAGAAALFYLDDDAPIRRRVFYAVCSGMIGAVFMPFLSDLAQALIPTAPASLRPVVGFLAVVAAVPFVTAWSAGWRRIAHDPEILWRFLLGFLPARFRPTVPPPVDTPAPRQQEEQGP